MRKNYQRKERKSNHKFEVVRGHLISGWKRMSIAYGCMAFSIFSIIWCAPAAIGPFGSSLRYASYSCRACCALPSRSRILPISTCGEANSGIFAIVWRACGADSCQRPSDQYVLASS